MILDIHPNMSLGDFIMCTGIPRAYNEVYGDRTYLPNMKMPELWHNNPYVTSSPAGQKLSFKPNNRTDYMIYYPVKIFHDLTGLIVDRDLVRPHLYWKIPVYNNVVVINDQSGWPTRRGYRYWHELVKAFRRRGFKIHYLRYNKYRDCMGDLQRENITDYDVRLDDLNNTDLIKAIGSATYYVGYDSGIAQLAGALDTPYIVLQSAVPPINTCHNSCIYAAKICAGFCCQPQCERFCLTKAPDLTEEIMDAVNDYHRRLSITY